jgi:hypothetical protein
MLRETEGCPAYIFLFARVDIMGPARPFLRTATVALLAGYGFFFVKDALTVAFCFVHKALESLGL